MREAITAALAVLAVLFVGCDFFVKPTSQVYQGVCISLENHGKTLRLENTEPDLNRIEGEEAVFELAEARVGLTPERLDTIRVAYVERKGVYQAVKVMNITKQDLRKK